MASRQREEELASRRREEEVASRRREEFAQLVCMLQGAQGEVREAMAASRRASRELEESRASWRREIQEAGTPWSAVPHC